MNTRLLTCRGGPPWPPLDGNQDVGGNQGVVVSKKGAATEGRPYKLTWIPPLQTNRDNRHVALVIVVCKRVRAPWMESVGRHRRVARVDYPHLEITKSFESPGANHRGQMFPVGLHRRLLKNDRVILNEIDNCASTEVRSIDDYSRVRCASRGFNQRIRYARPDYVKSA